MSDSTHPTNPFPGLRPFQFSESELFFGRERQSQELLRKLRRNRFLAVVGTSGSGKSSLVRAGLLPLLAKGFATNAGSRWRIALFRPGKNPIHNLARALSSPEAFNSPYPEDGRASASAQPESSDLRVAVIETSLRRSALGLADHARRTGAGEPENLLICVDQFEELFRFKERSELTNPEDDAAAFVKLLLMAARDKGVAVYVLLTMRSDFLGECAQFRDLPEMINEGQYLIPRLTRDEQRAAITEPAVLRGVEITPRLVQRLLNDVGDNPDHLPLLQHALMRTWDHWVNGGNAGAIDFEHYEAIGKMDQALSNHAQQTFDALPLVGPSRVIAEKLFKALTETVVNNKEIRRPAELAEVCGIANATPADVIPVIDHFRNPQRCFLMPPMENELTAETMIDISHESLIKGWELLKKWVEEEAKSKAMYQRIADAAQRRYQEEASASLWRDPDLKFALEWEEREQPNEAWAQRYDPQFAEAISFLRESENEQKLERAKEEDRLREERDRKEREQQRELALAQAAALQQQQIAEVERSRAEAAQGRETAERERAKEAQRREAAERARAETEGKRAEEQFQNARRLRNAAVRLRVAVVLLLVMLIVTGVFYARSRSESARARSEKNRADESAEKLRAANDGLRNAEVQLRSELARSRKLSADRQISLEAKDVAERKAKEAERLAKKQESLAVGRARELQTALGSLEAEKKQTAKAKFREDLERDGLAAIEKGDAPAATSKLKLLLDQYVDDSSREGQIAWSWGAYNMATAFRLAKDYDSAVIFYEASLKGQKSLFGIQSPELVPALHRISQVYYEQGSYEKSEKAYEELSGLLTKIEVTPESREPMTIVMQEIAKLHQDEARDLSLQARQESNKLIAARTELARRGLAQYGSTNPQKDGLEEAWQRIAELERTVASLQGSAARHIDEAEKNYEAVVFERESWLPKIIHIDPPAENHERIVPKPESIPEIMSTIRYSNLVDAYYALAGFHQEKARAKEEDENSLQESAAETDIARGLYSLARVLRENMKRSGETSGQVSDPVNPTDSEEDLARKRRARDRRADADRYERVAAAYHEQKRYAAAIILLDESLQVRRTVASTVKEGDPLAADAKPALVRTLTSLIRSQIASNLESEAQRNLDEVLKALDVSADEASQHSKLSVDVDDAYRLAMFLGTKQKYPEARRVLELVALIQRRTFPATMDKALDRVEAAAGLFRILTALGTFKYRQKDFPSAEQTFKEGLDLVKRELGSDSEIDYRTKLRLAELYSEQGRYEEALALFKDVQVLFATQIIPAQMANSSGRLEIRIKISGNSYLLPGPQAYLDTLMGLAKLYARQGDIQEAAKIYRVLIEVSEWVVKNTASVMPSLRNDDVQEIKRFHNAYENSYADALVSYVEFLRRPDVNQIESAKDFEKRAEEIRLRLGQKKEDDLSWW